MNVRQLPDGALAMLAAVAVLALMDALLKQLSTDYPPLQVACLRAGASLPLLVAWVVARQGVAALWPQRPGLQVARGLLGIALVGSLIAALATGSLGSVYAVYLSAPVLIALLSALVLGERLRARAWIAIGLGLAGVMVAFRPTSDELLAASSALALVAACMYALVAVLTRVAGLQDSPGTTSVWFLGIVVVGTGVLSTHEWVPIRGEHWPWIAGVGAAGALGQWLLTAAFASGSPGRVAPLEYTALLWAFLLDWLVFATTPGKWQIGAGLLVVLGGSLLIRAREATAPWGKG